MAWQNPKTNWVAGDIPGAGDFNRSEGNTQYLKERIEGNTQYLKERIDELKNEVFKRVQIVTGRYTGNGSRERVITLGFTPKAVIVAHSDTRLWLVVTEHAFHGVSIVTNGFRVTYDVNQSWYSNIDGRGYNYIAFV